MKKILLIILMGGLMALSAHAQIKVPTSKDVEKAQQVTMPSEDMTADLLKALNPGSGFTSPDKLGKLLGNNKSFVNDVLGILGGSGTEDEKLALINEKKEERKDFIETLLGEGKAAEYYKLVKKQVEPLIKKYALAKYFV